MTDTDPPQDEKGRRARNRKRLTTARIKLDSSFFPVNDLLSSVAEVEAARAAAHDLLAVLSALEPGDDATEDVLGALKAIVELLSTRAGGSSDWDPTAWWYEAKQLTNKAYESLGTETRWPSSG